jgi:hypothetical protein
MSRAFNVAERPGTPSRSSIHDRDRGAWNVAAWGLRTVMAVIVAYHLVSRNWPGAIVAGQGLVMLMIPPAISYFGRRPVPAIVDLSFVAGVFLQYASESFKIFELLTYWDKIAHPGEILFASIVATLLLLGYRDLRGLEIPDELSAAGAMLFGMALGGTFELIEFALDWFGNANLQKSNADTITDLLTNDLGAIFGTLGAVWLFRHRTKQHERAELGQLAEWLTGPLTRLLRQHGRAVSIVVALLFGLVIFAGWRVDRGPIPPPPTAIGGPATWTFAANGAPDLPVQSISGDWSFESPGVCRVNPERPSPGSEKIGLLALNPGVSYGGAFGFSLSSRMMAERPPLGTGTAMDVGLAFGVRGPDDFYLARISPTHDVIALDRYVHGRRRDVREELLRTRGDEWHELRLDLSGNHATLYAGGRSLVDQDGLSETDGGLALWARVTTGGCFQQANVQPLGAAALVPSPASIRPKNLRGANW